MSTLRITRTRAHCFFALGMVAAAVALPLGCNEGIAGSASEATGVRDRVAPIKVAMEAGETELAFEEGRGYLRSLLTALDVSVDTQTLVFSKTSFQIGLITAATPRAVYFNDDTYVAWEQRGRVIEIASMHPKLGPVFYSLAQVLKDGPQFNLESGLCLRCHDSKGMGGGGYPRLLIGSGIADEQGNLASHEGWLLTTPHTPIAKRWGGWYVTGTHGGQTHLGNRIARLSADGKSWEISEGANLASLDGLVDTKPYLGEHSDIVALMVLEHQIEVHNRMTALLRAMQEPSEEIDTSLIDSLADAMLFVDEAPLEDRIRGTSSFAEHFAKRGPFDAEGRTLREFDLETRVFRHRLSYLVHSEAFTSLPAPVLESLDTRFRETLTERGADGLTALEIWQATKP